MRLTILGESSLSTLSDHSAEMRAWHMILPDLARILVSAFA
jgi:hypothetical protein